MTQHRSSVIAARDRPGQPGEAPAVPRLSAEAERALCRRWQDRHDVSAANLLVGDALAIIAEIAADCGEIPGVCADDLIGECYVGLMRALCRFDPDCGERFATYAAPRVYAAVQGFILRRKPRPKLATGQGSPRPADRRTAVVLPECRA